MATSREVVAANRQVFGSVATEGADFVCHYCLGPVNSFPTCWSCNELRKQGAPSALAGKVVPMTAALSPSLWYSMLQTYKTVHREHGGILGALASAFLTAHERNLAHLLGGEPTLLTIVPSKRAIPLDRQPLRSVLAGGPPLPAPFVPVLRHLEGQTLGRRQYRPEIFAPCDGIDLANQRILLIEDTWVTGATAVSAAGALLELGAAAVALLPIARCVDGSFWREQHPYRAAMSASYDLTRWPRAVGGGPRI